MRRCSAARSSPAHFAFAEQFDEIDDGYAWQFPGDGGRHATLLEFAAMESCRCSLFHIELVFAPGLGPVWLTLRGPDGTREFIKQTFGVDHGPGRGIRRGDP